VPGYPRSMNRSRAVAGQGDLESPLTSAWAVPAAEVVGPLLN